ncbi:MAG: hypothetical protein ACK4TA_25645 [Saprospiraceae bacterium]
MDSSEKNIELVETVKKHFPHLHILVRAFDRPDTYELMDEGILHIYRETLDTSLRTGVDALKLLGIRAYHAERAARKFFKHDEKALKSLAAVRDDQKAYIDTARQRIEELENMLLADLRDRDIESDEGWDPETLRAEVLEAGKL